MEVIQHGGDGGIVLEQWRGGFLVGVGGGGWSGGGENGPSMTPEVLDWESRSALQGDDVELVVVNDPFIKPVVLFFFESL